MSTQLENDRVRAENGHTPTPDITSYRELARQLRRVGVVNRELHRRLPHYYPPATVGVLALLRTYGDLRMSRLTELLGIDLSVTSRHVAHAEERGWIERLPDPHDGRSRLLRPTEQGLRELDALSELTTEIMQEFLADWTPEDVATLTSLLDRLSTAFNRDTAPPPTPPAQRAPAAHDET